MTKEELRKMWEARVSAFRVSGQSTTEWCATHDIKLHQLRYWLRKYKNTENSATPAQWMSIEIDSLGSNHGNSMLVRIGKAAIEVKPGFDKQLLSDLVMTLADLC
ncbi:MAG: hypothetical protein Q7J06_08470 [Bacteroidales bacterium]|nr:hypothetical protein [Bacteroidales bacterium]